MDKRHLEKQARKEGGSGKTLPSCPQLRQETHSSTTGRSRRDKVDCFFCSLGTMTVASRTVWSIPAIVVLGRKKTSSQRDGGYRTSDCYLPTAQKVISPMTLRVFHTDMYLQSTPKCLCRRELLSNFSFVAVKARGLSQVSKLFSMH